MSARLRVGSVVVVCSFLLYGCAKEQNDVAQTPAASQTSASLDSAGKWGHFHSGRFELGFLLPAGHEWKIDDHSNPFLVATHAGTGSRVELRVFSLRDLANRQRCQAEAEAGGFAQTALPLSTVDSSDELRPDGFDTHTRVAVEIWPQAADRQHQPLYGDVLAFGAKIHRCFVFHFSTGVAPGHETELSDRLALARARILPSIAFDEGLTEPDAPVPRTAR